jgi:MFS family permease
VLLGDREVAGLLLADALLFVLLFGSYLTYLPELLKETFQASSSVIGLLVSCSSASTALCATQVERLARYVPKERLVAAAFFISAGALAAMPHLPRLWMVPAAAVVFGAGPGIAITAVIALLTERVPAAFRATILAANSTAIRAGQTAGPLLMGVVIAAAGTAAVFYAGAAVGVLAGLAAWSGLE